jgi:hypothetical protein
MTQFGAYLTIVIYDHKLQFNLERKSGDYLTTLLLKLCIFGIKLNFEKTIIKILNLSSKSKDMKPRLFIIKNRQDGTKLDEFLIFFVYNNGFLSVTTEFF